MSAAVSLATRQIADLLRGGLPLARSIEVARDSARSGPLRAALTTVVLDLHGGAALSTALARHERHFSPLYVGFVRSGETSGDLAGIFDRLSRRLDAERAMRVKLRNAAVYPAVVLATAAAVCVFLVAFVIPHFQPLFDDMGQRLPGPTRLLMMVARVIRDGGLPALGAAALAGWMFWPRVRRRAIALWAALYQHPRLAGWMSAPSLARWARTVSALLEAGFPLLRALALTRQSLSASPFTAQLPLLEEKIADGGTVAEALGAASFFPSLVRELAQAGQMSGRLPQALAAVADTFERETDASMTLFLSIFEPALIVVMAGVVGFVALAMLLPIFELSAGAS